ncbi:MAG TPA: class I SAM-dependent methyltransferase [Pyrinomonadaceae bacterium]
MATVQAKSQVVHLSACPLCDDRRLKLLPAPPIGIGSEVFAPIADQIALNRCLGCHIVFINPRPSEQLLNAFYDRDGYDCHNPHFAANWSEGDLRARFSLLDSYSRGNELLLDVGAGAGHLLRYARRHGWLKVVGVEIGKVAREQLQKEGMTVHEDFDSASDLVGKVDAVTMIQSLEHMPAPQDVLRAIARSLRPEGVFLVEVPNADSLRARLATSFLRPLWTTNVERYLAFPIHLLYFNAHSLRKLLEQVGFKVLTLGTIGMGVEELRSRPAPSLADKTEQVANTEQPQNEKSNSARIPSGAKQAIKKLTSTLLLGEQLIAVCRKS